MAVDCPATDYRVSNQASADALGAISCDTVVGNLTIGRGENQVGDDDLAHIDGLINITSVGGDLIIENSELLTDVDGLINITRVDGDLIVRNTAELTNLDGLGNIPRVVGDFRISNNAALIDLGGLAGITSVGGRLILQSNAALTNLDSFAGLTTVGDWLSIVGNSSITQIDGLVNITSVERVEIRSNNALTNLDGLAGLTQIPGFLSISSNSDLVSLHGLRNISTIGASFSLYRNDGLIDLSGLDNLSSVGRLDIRLNRNLANLNSLVGLDYIETDLEVSSNNSLDSCEALAPVLDWAGNGANPNIGGQRNVSQNASGCDSVWQILNSVAGPSQPVINTAVAIGAGRLSLSFSPSTTTDALFPIQSYQAACSGPSTAVSEAPSVSLLDNIPVTQVLTVSGYDPVSVPSSIEVAIDITHSDPSDLYVALTTPLGTVVELWNQGSSGGENLIGTFPTTLSPIDPLSSVSNESRDGDWTLLIEDRDVGPIVREGVLNSWGLTITPEANRVESSTGPITVDGITRGRDYSCTVAPVTGLGVLPASDPVTAKSDFPTVPTITSTDYENSTIRLTVSVADNGGADITEYAASCTDGTNTFTGSSSTPTIEVTGLTNGTAYTCTASATNAVGTSGASAATDSITPDALSSGLPIWLLYEATQ